MQPSGCEQEFPMTDTKHLIHYTVDSEPQTTDQKELAVRQILINAKDDPAKVYLIEVRGKDKISFEGKLDELIHMHDGLVFVTAAIGGGGVSEAGI
jgi:hypothetical protein